jgi:hypothetical protein
MTQILKFIRSDVVFDPETITTLSNALDNAWQRIAVSGSRLADPAYANVVREVVAKHIIDMAQMGEREQNKLTDGAVQFLAANYKG